MKSGQAIEPFGQRLRVLPKGAALGVAACVWLGAAACVPARLAAPATFTATPDTVEKGTLRGPFTGRVVDGAARAPVSGAMIYATWGFTHSRGLPSAAGFVEAVSTTDSGGNYRVAMPVIPAQLRGSVPSSFTLVVYKRGFVAYRSDTRFGDFGPRHDFAQQENVVALDRWQSEYSHARHLRFLGSGSTLLALAAWEAPLAAQEARTEKPSTTDSELRALGKGPYVVAAQLLNADDIKNVTGYDGQFETGPLQDIPDSQSYSSQHFKAVARPESWDVAFRLWRLGANDAVDRYEELVAQLPSAVQSNVMANRSFVASDGPIFGVGFVDIARGSVVLLTCGNTQCSNQSKAQQLADTIYQRLVLALPVAAGQSTVKATAP